MLVECAEGTELWGLICWVTWGWSICHLGLSCSDEEFRLGHFRAGFFFMIWIQTKIKIIYSLDFFLTQNESA